MTIDLDVLIVGGGVQGLWVLNDLAQLGYSTLLISRTPLGVGQTLHSHVYIHLGHIYPNHVQFFVRPLREARSLWDKLISERQLQQPEARPIFVIRGLKVRSAFQYIWRENGLESEVVCLPSIFATGRYSRGVALQTQETWLDGEQLIQALAEPVSGSIRHGEVMTLNVNKGSVQEVNAIIGGEQITFRPRFLVMSGGAGNQALLDSVRDHDRESEKVFQRHARNFQRLRKSLMVVMKGDGLPRLAWITLEDEGIFSMSRQDDGQTVWFLSSGVDEELALDEVIDPSSDPPIEKEVHRIQNTIDTLKDAIPDVFEMNLQWGVYTGFKSEHAPEPGTAGVPSEVCVEDFGVSNLSVIWPSKLTLAPIASEHVKDKVKMIVPTGKTFNFVGIPNTPISIGREKWRTISLMEWEHFKHRYQLNV